MEHIKSAAVISLCGLVLFLIVGYFTGKLMVILPILAVASLAIAIALVVLTFIAHKKGKHLHHELPKVHELHRPVKEPAKETPKEEIVKKFQLTHDHGFHHQLAEDPAHSAQSYIAKMRKAGMPDHEIKTRLVSVGWDHLAVDMELLNGK